MTTRTPEQVEQNKTQIVGICEDISEAVLTGTLTGIVVIKLDKGGIEVVQAGISIVEGVGMAQFALGVYMRKAMS